MENNFYLKYDVEYETIHRKHRGKFSYTQNIMHKWLKTEDIEELIKEVKNRVLKLENYEITFSIDSLDWYGSAYKAICKIYNEYGKIKYVYWFDNTMDRSKDVEIRYIEKKEIKSIIYNVFDILNNFVNSELTKQTD